MTRTTRPDVSGGATLPLLRAGAVVLATFAASTASVALGITPLLALRAHLLAGAPWSALSFDLLLGCLAAVTLCCCGCWLVCVTVSTAVEAVTGASSAAVRAVSPRAVRRLVLVCCGVAVGGTGLVTPAVAMSEEPGGPDGARTERIGTATVAGLPLPDRTLGDHLDEPVATAAGLDDTTHRVRPGDSLWSIAERQIPGADSTEIEAGWRRLHRANRAVIGPDPDLIIPGTTLRIPGRAEMPAHNRAPGESGATPHRKDAS